MKSYWMNEKLFVPLISFHRQHVGMPSNTSRIFYMALPLYCYFSYLTNFGEWTSRQVNYVHCTLFYWLILIKFDLHRTCSFEVMLLDEDCQTGLWVTWMQWNSCIIWRWVASVDESSLQLMIKSSTSAVVLAKGKCFKLLVMITVSQIIFLRCENTRRVLYYFSCIGRNCVLLKFRCFVGLSFNMFVLHFKLLCLEKMITDNHFHKYNHSLLAMFGCVSHWRNVLKMLLTIILAFSVQFWSNSNILEDLA